MSERDKFKAAARHYDNLTPEDSGPPPPKPDPFPAKWVKCRGCNRWVRQVNAGNLCEDCEEQLA